MARSLLESAKTARAWMIFTLILIIALMPPVFYIATVYGGAYAVFNCVFGVAVLGLNLYALSYMNREIKRLRHG